MSTAVLQVDLAFPVPETRVGNQYAQVLVFARHRTRVLGSLYLPVHGGEILGNGSGLDGTTREGFQAKLELLELWDELEWPLAAGSNEAALPSATVAICTRDRPEDVDRCLQALLQSSSEEFEILLVDNHPTTAATLEVTRRFGSRVRYIREDRPGLNVARNRALQEAQGEIVVFNDDDAVPEADWLKLLLRNFDDTRVLCVTGLTMPLELETSAQECFERFSPFGRGFERRVFDGTSVDPLAVSRVGAGANMALRKDAVAMVGPFDEALDAGTPTRSGGDHELFYRILKHGFRIVYDPEAVNWHRHRRSWHELEDTIFGYGVGVYAFWTRSLLREHEWRTILHSLYWLYSEQLLGTIRAALRLPGAIPLRLAQAEIRGCLAGPLSYARSRSKLRKTLFHRRTVHNEAGHQCHHSEP